MKKIIVLFLILISIVPAQRRESGSKFVDFFGTGLGLKSPLRFGQAINLDGSSELVSKANPVNLDLNGAERVLSANNTGFEINTIAWAGKGNHSSAQSNTDKKTGTYSLAITSSAAGNATNCDTLPSSAFTPLVAGEKYTIQGEARGTGVLGSELMSSLTNAGSPREYETFISTGNSITSAINSSGYGICTSNDLGSFAVGEVYAVTYTLTLNSGTVPTLTFNNAFATGTTLTNTVLAISGTNTAYFTVATASTTPLFISYVGSGIVTNYSMANISVKKITLPSITLSIGGQTKTISSISCVPGTFTRYRWELQATQAEVNQPVKLWANQADVIYWDDFTIKQAKDRVKSVWFKTSSTGTKKSLVSRYASSIGMHLYITTGNKLECIFSDGTTTATITGNTTVTDNTWRLATITVDRIGNMNLYLNGVADATAVDVSGLGVITTTASLNIGFNSSDYFNGLIGETQLVAYNDLAQSNVNASTLTQAYKQGLGTWVNGTIVGWWKFRGSTDSQMLQDYSGSANHLSGTNVTTADQERGAYPSK